MAAQCWLSNTAPAAYLQPSSHQQQQQPSQQPATFVSSSAYYGYVPVSTGSPTAAGEGNRNGAPMDMDVEEEANWQRRMYECVRDKTRVRKRCLVQDDVAGYVHGFKRFRQGEQWLSSSAAAANRPSEPWHYGLAQMYHEPLLRLSPAADFDCRGVSCHRPAAMTMTGNLKLQPAHGNNSNELEDMLLLTHGCSSYHHYRHSQATTASGDCSFEEAEF